MVRKSCERLHGFVKEPHSPGWTRVLNMRRTEIKTTTAKTVKDFEKILKKRGAPVQEIYGKPMTL